MTTTRSLCCILALATFALAPIAAAAQRAPEPGLRPDQLEAVQRASLWVLGAQQQEREIAKALDTDGFAEEIARLRSAVRELERADASMELPALEPAPGAAATSPSTGSATAVARPPRRQSVVDGADRLASRRATLMSQLTAIPSSRQRRVTRAAAAKLEQIEREVRDAMAAPDEERSARLRALERRLAVERTGASARGRAPDPTPTLQLLPRRLSPSPRVDRKAP